MEEKLSRWIGLLKGNRRNVAYVIYEMEQQLKSENVDKDK